MRNIDVNTLADGKPLIFPLEGLTVQTSIYYILCYLTHLCQASYLRDGIHPHTYIINKSVELRHTWVKLGETVNPNLSETSTIYKCWRYFF